MWFSSDDKSISGIRAAFSLVHHQFNLHCESYAPYRQAFVSLLSEQSRFDADINTRRKFLTYPEE